MDTPTAHRHPPRRLSGVGGNQDLPQCNETKNCRDETIFRRSRSHRENRRPLGKRSLETTGQGALHRSPWGEGQSHVTDSQSSFRRCRDHIDARRRAVRFRSRPLVNRWQAVSEQPSHIVNRAGKADRLAGLKPFAVPTKNGFPAPETISPIPRSCCVFPSALARTTKPPTLLRNQSRKPTLACEPRGQRNSRKSQGSWSPAACVT